MLLLLLWLRAAIAPRSLAALASSDDGAVQFPKDFLWGMATASYQIEGAWNESGCYSDVPYAAESGRVPDTRLIDFFRVHLSELARAIRDGAKVRAYHAWSLLDNFEWTDGYSQRYGLTYVDYRNQQRVIKDSGRWYGSLTATGQLKM